MRTITLILLVAALLQSQTLFGQDAVEEGNPATDLKSDASKGSSSEDETLSNRLIQSLNLPLKTAGGTQFWTDHAWCEGCRLQQNSLTGHWRLVDATDVRRASGSRSHCEEVLENLQTPSQEVEKPKHVVVLLHGLMRTHHSMKPIGQALMEAGYDNVIRFSYASTRSSIGDHAAALQDVLDRFPPGTRFSFIGHSMGNIVVRHMVGDLQRQGDPHGLLPRCHAMVMLGPPNQGAAIARRLASTGVFKYLVGKGGMELGAQWDAFVKKLATPPFPFMIIAGDLSKNRVQNPLVDGSSDFVVSVEEAKLEGAESFQSVPVLHSFLMSDDATRDLTIAFLKAHPVDQR